MGDMTEPTTKPTVIVTDEAVDAATGAVGGPNWKMRAALEAAAPHLDARPMLERESVIEAMVEQKNFWATDPAGAIGMATMKIMAAARPTPTRAQILSAIIAHVFEEGDTPLVRQGMPQQEWTIISLAADAVSALLRGDGS